MLVVDDSLCDVFIGIVMIKLKRASNMEYSEMHTTHSI